MNSTKKLTTVITIVLIAGSGILGLSCGRNINADSTPQIANAPAEKPVSTPAVTSTQVPVSLTAAGECGENIYDAAKVGNWKTASSKLTELMANAEKIRALKVGSADLDATLTKLENAVSAKDKNATLVNA